ncbi:translocation/assembly module TamB domain-containing protein [Dyadobacter fanqingshengii]|uniref:Translocation/assembly module TamB domain-containing protein n=1 Tax=Dyadobacter fanqingshengii TaxID=2906443 RepID=A0A9X1PE63_9BACT|nr:translocation/assembly module TamB domain-containing protein [Dyadobacter fanqingshengii]MCF0042917.1 translocation/assembly module TamB domain-containing protein [Dyadobacter fanqingshengii]USJ35473.1 translocation/assembly module TamB domain-containing protein [Dyadobacter fanqingshengii]
MKKALKVLAIVILTILILVGVLVWGIQTPFGQNFLTTQANSYLRKKLKTKVNIEKVRFDVPDWILLEGVYFEDEHGDTLVAGKRLYVDLDMYSLIKGNVGINKVELEGINANINRVLPDTVFNFQFIVDAFASADTTTTVDTTSSPMEMRLDQISLKNVRLSYRDAVTGTDAIANIDSAHVNFDKFNPTISQYHPSKLALLGSEVKLRMYQPLKTETTPETVPDPADSLDIKVGDIDIREFKWLFEDEIAGLKNGVSVGKLEGRVNNIYMGSQYVDVRNLNLEKMSLYAEFAKKAKAEAKKDTTTDEAAAPGWNVKVGDIKLVNNDLRYDDFNTPAQPKGLDFAHLDVKNLNVDLKDFIFSPENIAGSLKSGSFQEKSGFRLQEFRTNFKYGAQETYLRNLYVKTPNTLLRDELSLRYKNLDELAKDIANVKIKLRLTDSRVAFADILLLVPDLAKTPPFDKEPNGMLEGSGLVTGSVDDMLISKARFSMLNGTVLALDGRIQGLPDANKLAVDMTINELSSTKEDLMKMLPDSAVPASIELPEDIKITGKVKGSMENITMTTTINTSFGTGTFSGNLKNITDSIRAQYNGTLAFTDFDLGRMMKQPPAEMGKLTLRTDLEGIGYAPKTMKASLDGTVASADIKGYVYNNLTLKGDVDNGFANVSATMNDQNIDVDLTAQADLSKEYPSVKADVSIEKLDLTALHLYADSLQLKGNIKVDMPSTNPENPLGTVDINDFTFTHHRRPITIDSMNVQLTDSSGQRQATIKSPFLKAEMKGDFVYTEIADALLTEVGKHFKAPNLTYNAVTKPVNFTLDATVSNHPLITTFVPALKEMNDIQFKAKLDNQQDSSIVARLTIPMVNYDSIQTERVSVDFSNTKENAALNANVGLVNTGSFRIQNASLESKIVNNDVKFDFIVRDSVNTERHAVLGDLAIADNRYRLNLREGLLLDYLKWETDTSGYISYAPDSLYIKNFVIKSKDQSITINSTSEAPNSPLDIAIANISIGPMIGIATRDSTLATGILNGKILLSDYMKAPVYTGELTIDSLAVTKIPVGNLVLKSTNETENLIRVDMSLTNGENNMTLEGNYNLKSESPMDFKLDLKRLSAQTIEAFSFGELKKATGNLTGNIAITGATDSPRLDGAINFNDVAFNATQLGSRYSLANQKINFNGQNINFNNFIIADSTNQQMKINGKVDIANIPDVAYNLTIDAKNFNVLNSTQKQNELFYGKANIDADLSVKGQGSKSVIDGSIKVDPGSNITFVLPNEATEAGDASKGIIEFVDMSDSTQVAEADSAAAKITTVDFASQISLDIDVDDKSEFKVVIDELNGDNIRLKGNAQLNTGIAPNGQLFMLGSYDVTEGSYDLTLQILKRQFQILKGSNLLWTGDVMNAELNITAGYTVEVDPGSISAKFQGASKVPIQVQVVITGNLTTPNITFNIVPDETIDKQVTNELTSQSFWENMKSSPSEMNKQAFALLITNKFITDQSSPGFNLGSSAEAVARQSVSQLLSDQLNNLASDLVKGVDLDIGVNSTADQTTGARTDLNLGLSKAFLNDRLKISVGKNFEIESQSNSASSNEVFDNIALDYAITRDGRYLFRAFRKNQYQSILEGFIIETGVSFIVTADYDLLREFFQRQKNEK